MNIMADIQNFDTFLIFDVGFKFPTVAILWHDFFPTPNFLVGKSYHPDGGGR